jgi:hypothetical protein
VYWLRYGVKIALQASTSASTTLQRKQAYCQTCGLPGARICACSGCGGPAQLECGCATPTAARVPPPRRAQQSAAPDGAGAAAAQERPACWPHQGERPGAVVTCMCCLGQSSGQRRKQCRQHTNCTTIQTDPLLPLCCGLCSASRLMHGYCLQFAEAGWWLHIPLTRLSRVLHIVCRICHPIVMRTSCGIQCLCWLCGSWLRGCLQSPDGLPGRAAVLLELRKLRLWAVQVGSSGGRVLPAVKSCPWHVRSYVSCVGTEYEICWSQPMLAISFCACPSRHCVHVLSLCGCAGQGARRVGT